MDKHIYEYYETQFYVCMYVCMYNSEVMLRMWWHQQIRWREGERDIILPKALWCYSLQKKNLRTLYWLTTKTLIWRSGYCRFTFNWSGRNLRRLNPEKYTELESEVATSVVTKTSIFWDTTARDLLRVNQRFRHTLHLSSKFKNKPNKKTAWNM